MQKESELDFLGNEIRINDYIAFARNPYSDLILGKVIGFSPKGFKIIRRYKDGSWGGLSYRTGKDGSHYEVVLPYQCVKVNFNEDIMEFVEERNNGR